jgi:hypothetical protein
VLVLEPTRWAQTHNRKQIHFLLQYTAVVRSLINMCKHTKGILSFNQKRMQLKGGCTHKANPFTRAFHSSCPRSV